MSSARNCPTCGASLSPEAPEGLCPKCLLRAGLGETSVPTAKALNYPETRVPSPAEDGDQTEPEMTITRDPFRVRYFGDYELQGEIARGGMGVVYRARQVSLDRMVALKMILPDKLDDDGVKRFRQEAESAGNLDHPNIVPIYEVGKHDGQHFLSMKLIDGGSLKDALPRLRQDPRAAARLMVTVARAVHHAHQRGVLHRDLKPHNVLVDRDGQPHVTDFGLAKRVEAGRDVTRTGEWAGTLQYMPPEQADGEFKDLTWAADIYSLGATLYTLLTGVPPFQGSKATILHRIIMDEPTRPRSLDYRVDPDLETICLKCLEKEAGRRYATAGELADDLDRWLVDEPITARPVSSWERAQKWVRRKPAIAALSDCSSDLDSWASRAFSGNGASRWPRRRCDCGTRQRQGAVGPTRLVEGPVTWRTGRRSGWPALDPPQHETRPPGDSELQFAIERTSTPFTEDALMSWRTRGSTTGMDSG